MIIGTGCDLTNIQRIESSLNKFGDRFLKKIFSQAEIERLFAHERKTVRELACAVAKRFAAKEACSKALGTGINQGTSWKNMEISNLSSGQPVLELSGKALANLMALSDGRSCRLLVSMSDDYPWAQAFVIIEAQV